jgi:hypothetical protein
MKKQPADNQPPWNYDQFTAAMRAAGWKRIDTGYYQHTDSGRKFDCLLWTQERLYLHGSGYAWRAYAAEHTTPDP